jgi:hypothetical protein
MAQTIQELIDGLQKIEDKSQIYLGNIWIAEDFTYEDEDGEEIEFKPEDLEQISEYRGIDKSLGYLYDEILEYLVENLEEGN